MTIKRKVSALSALLVGVLLIALFSLRGGAPNLTAGKSFPERTEHRVFLKFGDGEESTRHADFWPGTQTLRHLEIEYKDGRHLAVEYRNDGTAASLLELYPASEADSATGVVPARKTKRAITYGADGLSAETAYFYREDGTVEGFGRQRAGLEGPEYEQLTYGEDGHSIVRQEVFTADGDYIFYREFDSEPTSFVSRKLEDGSEEKVQFRENGTRLSRTLKKPNSNNEDVDFYAADGLHREFTVFRAQKIAVVYYHLDGTVDSYREFASDEMTVLKYKDGSGTVKPEPNARGDNPAAAYKQYWKVVKGDDGKETYELTRFDEFDSTGKVTRRFHFSSGKVSRVENLDAKGDTTTVTTLRDDGTVERIERYQPQPNGVPSVAWENIPQERGLTVPHDDKLFKDAPFADPRPLVGPPVAPYYSYPYGYDGEYGYP
jgi:hypothetical protein